MTLFKHGLFLFIMVAAPAGFAMTPAPDENISRCGTPSIDEIDRIVIDSRIGRVTRSQAPKMTNAKVDIDTEIVVPVYFHIINTGDTPEAGNTENAVLDEQMDVLNAAYKSANITFTLAGVDRTTSTVWQKLRWGSTEDRKMRQALRVGDAEALNVYVMTARNQNLGTSNYPWVYENEPLLDGIFIEYRSLPGGAFSRFNKGMTLVHEAGHWLGVYHTFSGGCGEKGDEVADTPAQKSATRGCPAEAQDSCPDDGGVDAIHNYMDYSDDVCLSEFTAGQVQRMHKSFITYRLNK